MPPIASWLLDVTLNNLEDHLIQAAEGRSRGLALTQEVIVAPPPLANPLPNWVGPYFLVICVGVRCICTNKWDFTVWGLWVVQSTLICLQVDNIDLQETEAPYAVSCNMSRCPGYSQVIQYHLLSSPCANRKGIFSGEVGEGAFLCPRSCSVGTNVWLQGEIKWVGLYTVLLNLAWSSYCAIVCFYTTCLEC